MFLLNKWILPYLWRPYFNPFKGSQKHFKSTRDNYVCGKGRCLSGSGSPWKMLISEDSRENPNVKMMSVELFVFLSLCPYKLFLPWRPLGWHNYPSSLPKKCLSPWLGECHPRTPHFTLSAWFSYKCSSSPELGNDFSFSLKRSGGIWGLECEG